MLRNPGMTRGDICDRLKITRSTLYKFLAKHEALADPAEDIRVGHV